jgi:hypothetical protein
MPAAGVRIVLSTIMLIHTLRFVLRDFLQPDRAAFISYQMDLHYHHLYDISKADEQSKSKRRRSLSANQM